MSHDESELDFSFEDAVIESIGDSSKHGKIEERHTPEQIHILPMVRRPFFPGMAAPILIEPGPFFEVLKNVAKSDEKCIGLVLTRSDQADIYKVTIDDLYSVGVLARILRIVPVEQGGAQVIFNMEKRLTIIGNADNGEQALTARVVYYEDPQAITPELKAYSISIISTIKELLKLNPLFKEELQIFLGHSDFTDPGRLADFAAALTTATREEVQEVLSTFDIPSRIDRSLQLLRKELDISILQSNLSKKIDAAISKTQKEFFLREQMKTIKKELGIEKDDKVVDREKFEARLKGRQIPEDIQKVINEELEKLSVLEGHSAEYALTRNYLDWLTNIPWGIYDQESHDLDLAKKILAEDHYGLKEIKERVLEFMAVGKLSGSVKGNIICLVGPPGVGKTSVGKSIARALNRKFYRFSVGGMRDEAEIKGHRRTYVGAMPGKLIQALKYCQVMNPVIMLDEVDKMGVSYQGDPASALLEVLDPEQNVAFLDHYLDVRCNLSEVLFIVTANVLDTIPEPLRDRMEILRLSGYVSQEKIEIAKNYLIPRNRTKMGLTKDDVDFTTESLRTIIHDYAREAGVRTLEHELKKILRKVALKVVTPSKTKRKTKPKYYEIAPTDLKEYLGKPVFFTDRFYKVTPPGVCTGLAWTSHGGATLYIETTKVAGEKTGMKLTGHAGEVMKESSEIAWSYLLSSAEHYGANLAYFDKSQIHIHIPEGATPKDGPSAGITMVTALLSLLTGRPVMENLGMTGEITLTGQVLPVGGIREKFVAAQRSDLKEIILPKGNMRDVAELASYITKGIKVHLVEHYDEVVDIAFPIKKQKKKSGKAR